MDCCICSPVASVFRPPRNTICSSCYEGAKAMIAWLNEADGGAAGPHASKSASMNAKGICHGLKRMKEMEEREKSLEEKVIFLDAVAALREGITFW